MLKISAVALGCGLAVAAWSQDRPPREDVVGSWKGRVEQPGAPPYGVEMRIGLDRDGRLAGTTNYPELGCRGILTLRGESGPELRFVERIEPTHPRCVTAGHVLVRAENGTLAWGWATPGGALAARALLAREAPQVATAAQAAARPATGQGVGADRPANATDIALMTRAIDRGFVQWSTRWMWDRYIPGSAVIDESRTQNGVHLVRGSFGFRRGGGLATIPFASTLQKQGADWALSSLCYNDTTSGMTDCASNAISAGARNFLGLVIVGGLLVAISGYEGGAGAERDPGADLDAMRRQHEDETQRRAARQREEERLDAGWSRMFEPSTLLPPPATLN